MRKSLSFSQHRFGRRCYKHQFRYQLSCRQYLWGRRLKNGLEILSSGTAGINIPKVPLIAENFDFAVIVCKVFTTLPFFSSARWILPLFLRFAVNEMNIMLFLPKILQSEKFCRRLLIKLFSVGSGRKCRFRRFVIENLTSPFSLISEVKKSCFKIGQ